VYFEDWNEKNAVYNFPEVLDMDEGYLWIGLYQDKNSKIHWMDPDLEYVEWTGVGKKMPWGSDEPSDKEGTTIFLEIFLIPSF
jgi:hypothetical protein